MDVHFRERHIVPHSPVRNYVRNARPLGPSSHRSLPTLVAPINRTSPLTRVIHLSISVRSYVWPSVVMTGSLITSIVNGHWKESETNETLPSAAAARDK